MVSSKYHVYYKHDCLRQFVNIKNFKPYIAYPMKTLKESAVWTDCHPPSSAGYMAKSVVDFLQYHGILFDLYFVNILYSIYGKINVFSIFIRSSFVRRSVFFDVGFFKVELVNVQLFDDQLFDVQSFDVQSFDVQLFNAKCSMFSRSTLGRSTFSLFATLCKRTWESSRIC